MRAGCLQFKPAFCDVNANIAKIRKLLKNKEFDLMVLPELANSGYLFSDTDELKKASEEIPAGPFCTELKEISAVNNAFIVSGVCERAEDSFYNSSILVSPSGKIDVYRKTHLFYEEKKWFSPGYTGFNVYEIDIPASGKVKIGMMVCFDWIFPESARTLALKGAQIICHPSNLVLQYCQKAMFTRAVENKVFTITANRTGTDKNGGKELKFTGESVIVDPKGNYLYRGTLDGDECVVVELDPSAALDKHATELNDVFLDRRPDLYSL
jgi:predicted amidohydrolase